MSNTFTSRSTARDMAQRVVENLSIPEYNGVAGTYQSPARSRLLADIQTTLGGTGLLRASHLLAFMEAAELFRSTVYNEAANGSWEDPKLHLGRQTAALLPDLEALVKPDTARRVLDLLNTATFS